MIQYRIEPDLYVMGMSGENTPPGRYYIYGEWKLSYNPNENMKPPCVFFMCPLYNKVIGAFPTGINRRNKRNSYLTSVISG